MFGIGELAIILIVVILLLGAKRLPDLARSAGKSARILKSEARAMKADSASASTSASGPDAVPGAQYSVRPGEPMRDAGPTSPRDAGPTTPPRDAEGRPPTAPQ
ncbi:Sec-independent protein translocase subunit TatA [Streptomyces niveus]|uniref:Sec-independent protein translocase subunit TatA n=1 Tax=Streptomyces niveus TaxID=193462 RepID=UPI003435B2A5